MRLSALKTIILAVVIAAGPTSTVVAETVPAAPASSNIVCGADHLSVTWRGSTGGLAGHSGDLFWIRNTGPVTCELRGYPIVHFIARGRVAPLTTLDFISPLGRPTGLRRGPVPLVRLAEGKVASFWVVGSDVVTPCRDLASMVVVVRPLKGRAVIGSPSVYASWPFCGSEVAVSPIIPGASGSVPALSIHAVVSFGP